MRHTAVRAFGALIIASLLTVAGVTTSASAVQPADDVVSLTNQQRAAAGVPELTEDRTLDATAQAWASEMSRMNQMVHSTNEWRAARIPSGWFTNGENIAYGYTSAASVMQGWMDSPGHKENILRRSYTHIGVGYVASGNYWVQIFAGYDAARAPSTPPFGWVDGTSIVPSGSGAALTVKGWAIDRMQPTASIPVHVYVTDPAGRNVGTPVTSNETRNDVAAAFAGVGSAHGFTFTQPVTQGGTYTACAYAIGSAKNVLLGCQTATFGPAKPIGDVDEVAIKVIDGSPTLSVKGWALDNAMRGDTTQAHVYITDPAGRTNGYALSASDDRPDIATAFPGAGAAHGYSTTKTVTTVGNYTVCIYSIASTRFGAGNRPLGCRVIAWGPSQTTGNLDSVTANPSSRAIDVWGWGMDAAASSVSNDVHIYVTSPDGRSVGTAYAATGVRNDVAAVFRGAGAAHGFSATVPVNDAGTYTVCAYSISLKYFAPVNRPIGCRAVLVR